RVAHRDVACCSGLVLEVDHSRRLRHTRIFPVHHLAGRASHSRAAFVQALRAEATICFAVTIIALLGCIYTAGEEMSWGQHFFHWKTPEYWAMVNRQQETNLHNIYPAFEQWPRT